MKNKTNQLQVNCNTNKANKKTSTTPNKPATHEQIKKSMRCRLSQRQTIMHHLRKFGQITTLQAHQMGIMAPATRIKELRESGQSIETIRDWNKNGMATYVYITKAVPS